MKNIKELEADNYNAESSLTTFTIKQLLETNINTLKDVLGLIDEKLRWGKFPALEEIKARITG
ncbi:unnamed protein product [marine sediment metagenome]|uniref:Uncharacterized protein n=1 Tax=marine sediment metagenome TaxID=412755 RepID=X1B8Z5_9ZZZZ